MDSGHRETEQKLKKLEQRISKEYRQAEAEISAKLADYMKRYETKDKIWQKWVEDGKKTAKQYEEWRIGQLAMGQRWKQMRDTLAEDFHHANEIAKSITNGYMPEVYCINHDYATYEIEHGLKIDTSYTLYDKQTAELLLSEDAVGKRAQRIKDVKDITWNRKQVQSTMLQGIIQGKSIPDLATSLAVAVGEKNRKAAIRSARTMTTGVQNAGRVAGYERAKDMGINTRMQWVATLDGRTRHEHRLLDGQIRDTDEPFEIDGEEIRFPGDPQADPALVYNCRCTLIASIKGFERNLSDLSIRRSDKMGDMSYDEWKEAKATSQDILHQDKMAQKMKGVYINEYRGFIKNSEKPLAKGDVEAYNRVESTANANNIKHNPVNDLTSELSDAEIIEKLAGGDMTKGSCASLSLAYVANKKGLDVTDFRGGSSQEVFSRNGTIKEVMKTANAKVQSDFVAKEVPGVTKILKEIDPNKEYVLLCGRHAAIVRKTDEGLQYLEMQSKDTNGWKPFSGTFTRKRLKYNRDTGEFTEYEQQEKRTIQETLYRRFGCRKTVSGSYSLAEVDSFEKTEEFKKSMGFINTDKDKQKKGSSGDIK